MSGRTHQRLPAEHNALVEQEVAKQTRELLQANDQLHQEKKILQTIYDGLPASVVVLKIGSDGDIFFTNVNQCFAKLVGLQPDEIIGRHPREVIKPWSQFEANFWRYFNRCLQTQQTVSFEQGFETDGQERYYLIYLSPLVDEQGQLSHLLGAALEITARKQAEDELGQAKAIAEAAARAKSDYLASISHELRTPLNAILGFSKLLGRDASLSVEQGHYTEVITRSAEHLLTLINDILYIAKTEANWVELLPPSVDLHHLLDQLYDLFEAVAAKKGLRLNLVKGKGLPHEIRSDPLKLRQVLLSLLGNAIKFTERGSVTFRVRVTGGSRTGAAIRKLRYEIQDTGPGIAPEALDELFEPFTQAGQSHLKAGGPDLGLPLCHHYVTLMGGELRLKSKLNQGTTCWFELPLDSPAPDQGGADETDTDLSVKYNSALKTWLQPGNTRGSIWQNPTFDFTQLRLQLAELNPQLVADLHQAAIDLDAEQLRLLLLRVGDTNKALAQFLLRLVDNFAYDELFSLTDLGSET